METFIFSSTAITSMCLYRSMEGWWPQWKYLWAYLRDSLSGHAQGQNNLLPYITWHQTLFSIQVTCDLQLWEGTATSCSCSCACKERQLRSSLQNRIGAHSCMCITDLRSLTPKYKNHASHSQKTCTQISCFSLWTLPLIWVDVLSALKLNVYV